ncbi:hypothetical protein [Burkholderia sp. BCC0322]|uniref:hypothetical protein n=1 Tax=unclassified Burkholderia TaxID=2613784 RepID=UPI00158C023E|nr:hypothetical protein [Burkholderia sp. BCC0322]
MANESVATGGRVKIKLAITIEECVRGSRANSADFNVDGGVSEWREAADLVVFLAELVAAAINQLISWGP